MTFATSQEKNYTYAENYRIKEPHERKVKAALTAVKKLFSVSAEKLWYCGH